MKAQSDAYFTWKKSNILQIRIPVARVLQISENILLCVSNLATEKARNTLNTANPPIRVFPLWKQKNSKRFLFKLFLTISLQIYYTSYKSTANFPKPFWNPTEIPSGIFKSTLCLEKNSSTKFKNYKTIQKCLWRISFLKTLQAWDLQVVKAWDLKLQSCCL